MYSKNIILLPYLAISIATFLVLQGVGIVMHEFTHSFTAWSLGIMAEPLAIEWGNPIMMTGWDEGVSYRRLFADGFRTKPALAGIMPLVMHTVFIYICITLMKGNRLVKHRWAYNAVFWFTTVHFMELVAYVYMRAFSGHGDIGNFDKGMEISPWWVFIIGSAALTWGLWSFYNIPLKRLIGLFGQGNKSTEWAILGLTSFIIFLWGSGIRVMAYVPGPQWMFGLMGFVGFGLTLWLCRPTATIRQDDRA